MGGGEGGRENDFFFFFFFFFLLTDPPPAGFCPPPLAQGQECRRSDEALVSKSLGPGSRGGSGGYKEGRGTGLSKPVAGRV